MNGKMNATIKFENWTVVVTPTANPWLVQLVLKNLEKRA